MTMADRAGGYRGNKGLEYYRAYPRDFFEGVVGMPGQLRGFYRMVLDLIYMHDGFLLADFQHISGHTGYGPTQCKRMLAQLVEAQKISIWPENPEYFTNKRVVSELKTGRKFQENQRKRALERWENNGLTEKPAQDAALPEGIPPQDHKTTIQSPSDSCDTEKFPLFGQDQKKPKPSLKPQRFDEFWEAYPHRGGVKRGRAASLKKYEAALRAKVPEATIINAAKDFCRDKKALDGFAPDPAGWLHNSGWDDEIDTGGTKSAKPETPAGQELRRSYLERIAEQMQPSGESWVIGSRFVDDRDLADIYRLGISPDKLGAPK